jgi:tetratricopeptide (TPR) repeat protein
MRWVVRINMNDLSSILAMLYSSPEEVRSLVRKLGMNPDQIDLKGASTLIWERVLQEAWKLKKLELLIDAAGGEYVAWQADLTKALKQYLHPLASQTKSGIDQPSNVLLRQHHLPRSDGGSEVFGRESELDYLNAAWDNPDQSIVSLVGDGGAGKTSVVKRWLAEGQTPGRDKYIFWSFYRHGITERSSSDLFIEAAFNYFGILCPPTATAEEKGDLLAEVIGQHQTLLVLDGLEPLQDKDDGIMEKDKALATLLEGLAVVHQKGQRHHRLCVITTRRQVRELVDLAPAAAILDIGRLPDDAAIQLLKSYKLTGPEEGFLEACREVGFHALSLTLQATYVRRYCDGMIAARRRVPIRTATLGRSAEHADRIMEWHAQGLGEGLELVLLKLLGLFHRPADRPALSTLLADPPIPGLTDSLEENISDNRWHEAVSRLRDDRLINEASREDPDRIDAHPLIRVYFGRQLRTRDEAAWREGHRRLYEHILEQASLERDPADEVKLLYSALFHACQADLHREAFENVYIKRIQRGKEQYSTRQLGLFGEDLAALAGFFDPPWDNPLGTLTEDLKADLFALVGSRLRAIGSLGHAIAPTEKALEMFRSQSRPQLAARKARHLAEIHLAIGSLNRARSSAENGVKLADLSGSAYERYIERSILGAALHRLGERGPALDAFREAERILREEAGYPPLDRLYSLSGFYYCDLLLDEGEYEDVRRRAVWMQEMTNGGHTRQDNECGLGLISIGMEWLLLGRVGLLQLERGSGATAVQVRADLDHAVEQLRRAGRKDFIPLGFLARAAFRRLTGDLEGARTDLEEARKVADGCLLGLHIIDCLLEESQLELALGNKEKAREVLRLAREPIAAKGYHRRDPTVTGIEQALGKK